MKNPGNATLFEHWLSIRRGRLIPDRSDLDPVAIRSVLAFTFVLEIDGARPATRSYPVRVSGTRLDALFGHSVKDESFTGFWLPEHAAELRSVLESVVDDGRPAVMGARAAPRDLPSVPVEVLMLPLRCQGRTHARLICSLAPLSIPTWLGLRGIEPLSLSTWRMIDTAQYPQGSAAPIVAPALTPEIRRERFTVVQGGRSLDPSTLDTLSQSRIKSGVSGSHNAVLSSQAP